MVHFFEKYIQRCPRSKKIIGMRVPEKTSHLLFPLLGLAALVWIIIRVATKPSRITYPCMKIAVPLASTCIGYLLLPFLVLVAWLRSRKKEMITTALFAVAGISGVLVVENDLFSKKEIQLATIEQPANQPIGKGVGIFPGRVVWVHNPDATNENCNPSSYGHAWFMPENNNQVVIDSMVSTAIRLLTGEQTDSAAWNAIFRFHNAKRGKGSVPYRAGEKIFIKINATSSWSGNYNTSDLSAVNNSYYGTSETSPAVVLSVLRQLVNVVGVAQTDIYVGDPMKHIYKHSYDLWHSEFPQVHYLDNSYSTLGREKVVADTTKIYYSDKGTVLREGVWYPYNPGTTTPVYKDSLYTIFSQMEYMLNIPMLKGHRRAGITAFAKNHFGSHPRGNAAHLHNGLIAPMEMENGITRPGYGLYRVQVDIMHHSILGKKNLFYLMDALWATSHELNKPLKWQMAPFNNDWMSSVFASFDPVAIESVGYDFLRAEFTAARGAGTYVQMDGVDDYLHQAADSLNWPSGIKYDPDGNGNVERSLGVHEHWDSPVTMRYARNLGASEGIELIKADKTVFVDRMNTSVPCSVTLYQNYPNPFNPTTTIFYELNAPANITMEVFDVRGRRVATLAQGYATAGAHSVVLNASEYSSGVYFVHLTARSGEFVSTVKTMKISLVK